MKSLSMQTSVEIKLWLRRQQTVFFSLLLPVLFLLFFGALYGRQSVQGSHISYINYIVPGYAVFATMSVALATLGVNLATERQFGILKRLGGTPLPRAYLIAAKLVAGALLAGAVVAVLVVFGTIFYGAHVRGNILSAILVLVLGILSFAAMGIALGGSVKPDSALPIANLVYLGFSFLGGVFIPLSQFPQGLLDVARVLPSEHMVNAMQGIWTYGRGINQMGNDLLVLAAWGAAALFASRRFRWE